MSTAAVSLAPTLGDLPVIAAEVIRIAFRLGALVDQVSQNLQPRPAEGTGDSWAYVVPGVAPEEAQKELDAIHKAEVSCSSTRPPSIYSTPQLSLLPYATSITWSNM
ncbi:hypothetical protein J3E69DRAFT_349030 [Trichoderma sp. SZMC 28015]